MWEAFNHEQTRFGRRLKILRHLASSVADEIELMIDGSVRQSAADFADHENRGLDEQLRALEIHLIRLALRKTGWKQIEAARILKVKPSTLNARIKRYGITPEAPPPAT